MKVPRFALFCYFPSLLHFSSQSRFLLPVRDGRTGSVSDPASRLSSHTVGCLGWTCAGQRILLRLEQPRSSGWHHLQGSEFFKLQRRPHPSQCLFLWWLFNVPPCVRFIIPMFMSLSPSVCSGVPVGSQCHHSQFAAGSCAVESYHTQMCFPS